MKKSIGAIVTKNKLLIGVLSMVMFVSAGGVYAANNSDLTLQILAGSLATDIIDDNGVSVTAPTTALSTSNFSFACQSGANASTGTLGTNTQRLYAINPGAANNGFTLSIAATAGPTALWENSGATQTFDYNDAASSGCTDGADADTRGGQLTINPSVATLTADCTSCTNSGVTTGSSTAFVQGSADSITILSASAGSDDFYRGYLTGIGLSQTIPAEQAVDSYELNLTLSIVAL